MIYTYTDFNYLLIVLRFNVYITALFILYTKLNILMLYNIIIIASHEDEMNDKLYNVNTLFQWCVPWSKGAYSMVNSIFGSGI